MTFNSQSYSFILEYSNYYTLKYEFGFRPLNFNSYKMGFRVNSREKTNADSFKFRRAKSRFLIGLGQYYETFSS